jgi:hypothetical protein
VRSRLRCLPSSSVFLPVVRCRGRHSGVVPRDVGIIRQSRCRTGCKSVSVWRQRAFIVNAACGHGRTNEAARRLRSVRQGKVAVRDVPNSRTESAATRIAHAPGSLHRGGVRTASHCVWRWRRMREAKA